MKKIIALFMMFVIVFSSFSAFANVEDVENIEDVEAVKQKLLEDGNDCSFSDENLELAKDYLLTVSNIKEPSDFGISKLYFSQKAELSLRYENDVCLDDNFDLKLNGVFDVGPDNNNIQINVKCNEILAKLTIDNIKKVKGNTQISAVEVDETSCLKMYFKNAPFDSLGFSNFMTDNMGNIILKGTSFTDTTTGIEINPSNQILISEKSGRIHGRGTIKIGDEEFRGEFEIKDKVIGCQQGKDCEIYTNRNGNEFSLKGNLNNVKIRDKKITTVQGVNTFYYGDEKGTETMSSGEPLIATFKDDGISFALSDATSENPKFSEITLTNFNVAGFKLDTKLNVKNPYLNVKFDGDKLIRMSAEETESFSLNGKGFKLSKFDLSYNDYDSLFNIDLKPNGFFGAQGSDFDHSYVQGLGPGDHKLSLFNSVDFPLENNFQNSNGAVTALAFVDGEFKTALLKGAGANFMQNQFDYRIKSYHNNAYSIFDYSGDRTRASIGFNSQSYKSDDEQKILEIGGMKIAVDREGKIKPFVSAFTLHSNFDLQLVDSNGEHKYYSSVDGVLGNVDNIKFNLLYTNVVAQSMESKVSDESGNFIIREEPITNFDDKATGVLKAGIGTIGYSKTYPLDTALDKLKKIAMIGGVGLLALMTTANSENSNLQLQEQQQEQIDEYEAIIEENEDKLVKTANYFRVPTYAYDELKEYYPSLSDYDVKEANFNKEAMDLIVVFQPNIVEQSSIDDQEGPIEQQTNELDFLVITASGEQFLDLVKLGILVVDRKAEIYQNLESNDFPECNTKNVGEKINHYIGPKGTAGVGECKQGELICEDESWIYTIQSVLPDVELCNGLDDNCDGNVDAIENKPLQFINIAEKIRQVCENGEWIDVPCAEKEVCDNKVDDDCDGLPPKFDSDCMKMGYTRPGAYSKSDDFPHCGFDAWNSPSDTYDPAKNNLWEMNSDEWTCTLRKIYIDEDLAFATPTFQIKSVGGFWLAMHETGELWEIFDWTLETASDKIIKGALKTDTYESEMYSYMEGKVKEQFYKIPPPDAYGYKFCPGAEWDAVYSLKRDWVCYNNDVESVDKFDWHDMNFDGTTDDYTYDNDEDNYMTSVKNQHFLPNSAEYKPCFSCWAHAILGVIEAQYNIDNDDVNMDLDLSEQSLMCYDEAGNCNTGAAILSKPFLKDGVLKEQCLEYKAENVCSDANCDDRVKIKDFVILSDPYLPPEEIKSALKMYLKDKGPLAFCINWGDEIPLFQGDLSLKKYLETFSADDFFQHRPDDAIQFDDNYLGRCDGRNGISHCVVIVGYDDNNGYWIVKNDYGLFHEDKGYFYLPYDAGCSLIGDSPIIGVEI